jgi:hypothetical protein
MRTALLLLALAGSANADAIAPLKTLHAFHGIDLLESRQAVSYEPSMGANLDSAWTNWQVRDDKAHVVVAKRLELRTGRDGKNWIKRKALTVTEYTVKAWDNVTPVSQSRDAATLPAKSGRYQVTLSFAAERVADDGEFAMTLEVDGKRVDVELPLEVYRELPKRSP